MRLSSRISISSIFVSLFNWRVTIPNGLWKKLGSTGDTKTRGFPSPSHGGFGFEKKKISVLPTEQVRSIRNWVGKFYWVSPFEALFDWA